MADIGKPIRRFVVIPTRRPAPNAPEPVLPSPPVRQPEQIPEREPA